MWGGAFTEQVEQVAAPRALLTVRACWWAINQIRREHASVQGLARQLGAAWRTVWTSIKPILETLAADESRFDGVHTLGVDEHVWHHVSTRPTECGGRGPKELAELVRNLGPWRGIDDLEIAVAEYTDWYNHRRLHGGAIGHVPPVEAENNFYTNQPAITVMERV